jgi:hypothetical protein
MSTGPNRNPEFTHVDQCLIIPSTAGNSGLCSERSVHRTDLGMLGDVPPAAQRLDQEYAGVHATPQNIDFVPLVFERNI